MCFDPPEAPDYGPLAELNERISNRALDFQDKAWKHSVKASAHLMRNIDRVVNRSLKTQADNAKFAEGERERYLKEYVPRERKFAKEADEFATEERRDRESGRAISEVGTAFSASRRSAERRLAGYGVDPSMVRGGALDLGSRIEEAEAKAQAGTGGRRRIEDTGRAMRADVINMGRGMPSSVAQAYGTSLAGGQLASGSAVSGGGTSVDMRSAPAVYGSQAIGGAAGAGNALNMGYNNALSAYDAGPTGFIKDIAAMGAGGYASTFDEGGPVTSDMSPSRGAIPDDVPARLTAGEHVIPDDVVKWKGEEYFTRLIAKSREARKGAIPETA